jgi:intracellular sulfur oxidation DsrE/DsrF family protein
MLAGLGGYATTGVDGAADGAAGPDKVVYRLNGAREQATNGLRNVRNHLEVNRNANTYVVSHLRGVDFLWMARRMPSAIRTK